MPFIPRTKEEILADMIAFMRMNSTVTDYNVGSVARTILEAAALEDREQYMKMVQILKAFSYRTASSDNLDRRASDFNITRMPASQAYGNVIIMDDGLSRTYLTNDVTAGSSVLSVEDASVFSTPPITARFGEQTSSQEDVTISDVDLDNSTITLSSGLTYAHSGLSTIGTSTDEWELSAARVSEVSGDEPQVINSGIMVQAPPVGDLAAVKFTTTEAQILLNGNFQTEDVSILATNTGTGSNVGPKRINTFSTSAPFSNAKVVNTRATGGGIFAETDLQFAERIEETIGSLSGATVNAIISECRKVSVPLTNQKVGRVSLREEFVVNPDEPGDGRCTVFVDDGTGDFVAEYTTFPYGSINGALSGGEPTVQLDVAEGTLPDEGYIILDPGAITTEVVEYASIDYTGLLANIYLVGTVTNAYEDNTNFVYVEQLDDSTTQTQKFYTLPNIAIMEGDFQLFSDNGTTVAELTRFDPTVSNFATAEYLLAAGVGQVELIDLSSVPTASKLYTWYSHYDGLLEEVQRTVDGDIRNPTDYPGVKAAGVNLVVLPPNYVVVNIHFTLILNEGVDGAAERERADRITRNYMGELNCGESLVLTELIKRVKTSNVVDVIIHQPTSNISADDDEVLVVGSLVVT